MTATVHSLVRKRNAPGQGNVRQLLRELLDEFETGKGCPPKAMVLLLDDADDIYRLRLVSAGLRPSEIITLCSVAQCDTITRLPRGEAEP